MQTFAGYTLERELGRGGTAVVYLASKDGGAPVALKVLNRHGRTEEMARRFEREIEAMGRLDHPRVLRLVDHGVEGEDLWYAMEFSEKRSLQDVLEERHAGGGILEVREFLRLARGLAEALAYLHEERVVHRDLKPENILVDEALEPTLMDFGLAKDFERSEMTAEGMIMGTPRYMAPEQVQGGDVNTSTDVYQVGLILYRALTGKLPLEDENPFATAMRRMQEAIPPPSGARPNIPPGIDRILLQCLRSHPEERYPDMGAFRDELARLDPETGELRAGEAMPGKVAEARPEGTMVTSSGAFARAAGEGTMMTRGAPPPRPASGARAPASPVPAPEPGGGRVVVGVGLGFLLLGGLVLALRGGASLEVEVESLALERRGGSLDVSFETDLPVQARLELDPPAEGPYALGARPGRTHMASLAGLEEGEGYRYRLRLRDEGGAEFLSDWQRVPEEASGDAEAVGRLQGLRVVPAEGGVDLMFRSDVSGDAAARWGTEEPLERRVPAAMTGGRMHSVPLRDLPEGEDVLYSVELRTEDGKLVRTPVQLLPRGP